MLSVTSTPILLCNARTTNLEQASSRNFTYLLGSQSWKCMIHIKRRSNQKWKFLKCRRRVVLCVYVCVCAMSECSYNKVFLARIFFYCNCKTKTYFFQLFLWKTRWRRATWLEAQCIAHVRSLRNPFDACMHVLSLWKGNLMFAWAQKIYVDVLSAVLDALKRIIWCWSDVI